MPRKGPQAQSPGTTTPTAQHHTAHHTHTTNHHRAHHKHNTTPPQTTSPKTTPHHTTHQNTPVISSKINGSDFFSGLISNLVPIFIRFDFDPGSDFVRFDFDPGVDFVFDLVLIPVPILYSS